MSNAKNIPNGITAFKVLKKDTFSMRCMTIFMNNRCAIKKETNPILKGKFPGYIKNTSPKKEKINAVAYHLLISITDLEYKNNSDSKIKGLNK